MSQAGLEPTAQGAFAKTPLPHLLVYAMERALSGTFELRLENQSVATILFIGGAPAKIRTLEANNYLGEVMLELGLITKEQLDASLEKLQESPRLQGQILVELGFCDAARVELGVRAQLERKLEQLFVLPAETVFDYYDAVDILQRYGGPPTPLDPLPAMWRGIRSTPAWEHVDGTLRRVGAAVIRVAAHAQLDRFQFGRNEAAALDLIRQRPMRVVDLANAKVIGPSIAQLLVYTLVITKQVDLVEPQARSSPPSPIVAGQAAIPPPPVPNSAVPSSSNALSQTAQSQAFARVQLQARQVTRQPVVVEEVAVTASPRDGRIASPMPQAIPLDQLAAMTPVMPVMPPIGAGGPLDIGALISHSISSSMPPAPIHIEPIGEAPPSSGSVVPAPPSSREAVSNGPPSSQKILTAEQSSLKQKIVDRAHQITGQDYFQMLGLERTATPEQINKAFLQLAKVWHPDRLPPALVDVRDACSKVFAHLTEANATLTDPKRREEYMTLLKDGGATPDDQAKIQTILEAATEFQKAEFHLKRGETQNAYEIAKRAHEVDPDQADYLAMVTWIEAQRPEWSGREKTLEKVAVFDKCIKMSPNCERAYFYRGMLYKRIDELSKANKDFKKAAEVNPRNLDAMREVRLYNMRGGTKPPPGGGPGSMRPPGKPSKPPPETLGGLFGKLFKK